MHELLNHPRIISAEPFIPESWDEIIAQRVFPAGVNAPWYAAQIKQFETLAAEQLSAWRISFQGEAGTVTGIAALPKNASPDSALPLVVFNRGGSREYGRLTVINLVFPIADLVKAGYGVIACNYRGNHGGEGREEFGGAEVQDVLDTLTIGKELPWWDGQRAYLLGWSRGGMMTYLALKHGAEVQAAATLAGIASLLQSLEEREDMMQIFNALIPEAKQGKEALVGALRARSATEWPEKLRVPLLMLHGDADKNVSYEHSAMLAQALESINHPHKLVHYEAGTHSLSRYHKEISQELLAWFDAHR